MASEAAEKGDLIIANQIMKVTVDPSAGSFSVASLPSGKSFIAAGALHAKEGSAKESEVSDKTFGKGQEIEISHADGNRDVLAVFPDLPFVLAHSVLHNGNKNDVRVTSIQPFASTLNLDQHPGDLRALSTAGLTPADKHPGGYEWLAVADPQTRHGVVAGWITHDRAGGVMLCDAVDGHVVIHPQLDYGRLRIVHGGDAQTETLAIGYFDDARLGLETWAATIARVYDIKLRPQPSGYCTWYSDKHGGASDEKHLAELTAVAHRELQPFGFSVVQIDDGWQQGVKKNGPKKVFAQFNPKGPYPGGMKATAENITHAGLTPGIWFMPFAASWYDPFFKDHQDWFVKSEDGKPYESSWGGTSLDMTQPGAREYLKSVVHTIAGEWGYRYFKMDGMYTGTATKQTYVNSSYKLDGMGDAVFFNPDKTNIEAYRDGIKLVREAAGNNVFILGCCAPQNMRSYGGAFGLIDAMRVGPDNGPSWKSLLRGPTFASRSYFLNGRVWYNDPDPVYVRPSVPIEHARLICSWVAISGALDFCSEWLPELPADRMDLLKRSLPSHGLPSRPVDLFENDPPRIWLLTDDRQGGSRSVVGLYNWTSEPLEIDTTVERLGLPAGGKYVAFDYWANAFVPAFEGRLKTTLPKESCQVLAVRAAVDHPQVISTSRHITQGIVDLTDETWDGTTNTLSGRSRVVANDPYELRIVTSREVDSVAVSAEEKAAGAKIARKNSADGLRVGIDSAVSREVAWSIHFK
jgi:hypothetical protein